MNDPNLLDIWVDDITGLRRVGVLERIFERSSALQCQTAFYYLDGLSDADAISLTMPVRRDPYKPRSAGLVSNLPPIFDQNLPEGILRDYLIARYAKAIENMGDFDLLALCASQSIGRVRACLQGTSPDQPDAAPFTAQKILASKDTSALLSELMEKFATRSGVSGIQPKVLLPHAPASLHHDGNRLTLATPDYLVKGAGVDYPGLAINEYLCMKVAQLSGLTTARTSLSDDHELLLVERFDRDAQGRPLGFEDMACLSALTGREKYQGSYEEMVRNLNLMLEPADRATTMKSVFKMIAVSCVLGNGDAHLKNFGLLYDDPTHPACLAPTYDTCCTLAYERSDTLALSMGASREFPWEKTLTRFGRTACQLTPQAIQHTYDDVLAAVELAASELSWFCKTQPSFAARCGEGMKTAWEGGVQRMLKDGAGYRLPSFW